MLAIVINTLLITLLSLCECGVCVYVKFSLPKSKLHHVISGSELSVEAGRKGKKRDEVQT